MDKKDTQEDFIPIEDKKAETEQDSEQNPKQDINPIQKDKKIKKKGRLIIRNLVFDISEKHLRKLFSKYGEIKQIDIPLNPATNKSKGFAFVEMANKNNALKAIKELNETQFKGRTILLDLAVEKDKYEKQRTSTKKVNDTSEATTPKKENEEHNDDNDDDMDEDEESMDEEKEANHENTNKTSEIDSNKKSINSKNTISNDDEDLSSTVFVRNIHFDAEEKQLKECFQKFGTVKYAKLVKSKITEQPTGTGFIKMSSPEEANKLIELSNTIEKGLASSVTTQLATNELELNGRRLIVLPAIKKQEAQKLKSNNDDIEHKSKEPQNKNSLEYLIYQDKHKKRNIHLAVLGLNNPDDKEFAFDERDKEAFKNNLKEKIEKLKNPNYFVSPTTILLKHLSKKDFDEDNIKEILKDVFNQKYGQKQAKKMKIIKRIHLEREKERVDAEGHQKSRGFGFVEFCKHEDALYFLEYLCKNYNLLNTNRIPIIEFAIDDIRLLKKKEKIIEKNKKKQDKINEERKSEKEKHKEQQAKERKNREKIAKIEIERLLEEKDQTKVQEIRELVNKVYSRGLKQRLKKKIGQVFNLEKDNNNFIPNGTNIDINRKALSNMDIQTNKKPQKLKTKQSNSREIKKINENIEDPKVISLLQKKVQKAWELIKNKKLKDDDDDDNQSELKKIQKKIKNKKKDKKRKEDKDELDELANKYLQKKKFKDSI